MDIIPTSYIEYRYSFAQPYVVGEGLVCLSQEFLVFLVSSQNINNMVRIKNLSKILIILMCIGDVSRKNPSDILLSSKEEKVLVEQLTDMMRKTEGEGLDVQKLESSLDNLLENGLNLRCKIIALLTHLEYLFIIDAKRMDKASFEQFKTKTIESLYTLSDLNIKQLEKELLHLKDRI